MVVNAAVNQVDSELPVFGQKALVRLDAYPGLELPATSTRSAQFRFRPPAEFHAADSIRLKLDKVDPRVVPDMSASAT